MSGRVREIVKSSVRVLGTDVKKLVDMEFT